MDMDGKVVNEKHYGKTDKEKVDLGRLYCLYAIAFIFLFFCVSFVLLELSEVSNY